MVSFPLPILTFLLSAVACFVVFRQDLGPRLARGLFAAFFGLIALGSLLVGMRFGYGVEAFVPVQRALPLFGGPLLFLGFAVLCVPHRKAVRLIAGHLGVAVAVALILPFVARDWEGTDLVIGLSYAVYAGAILWLWGKGANHLTRARLERVAGLRRSMLLGAAFLFAFLLVDGAIAISFALERSEEALTLISLSSLFLFGVLALVIFGISTGRVPNSVRDTPRSAGAQDHEALAAKAEDLLTTSQLYLDTELTVDRLAKRLHVPSRNLSAAVNQQHGMNVSQYVNGFRLRHAAALLSETDLSVVKVMEQSGFLTRSNFYREFQRAYGQTPAAYRQG